MISLTEFHPVLSVFKVIKWFLQKMCAGGYGTVYRARRKSDGRKFAIKCKTIMYYVLYFDVQS